MHWWKARSDARRPRGSLLNLTGLAVIGLAASSCTTVVVSRPFLGEEFRDNESRVDQYTELCVTPEIHLEIEDRYAETCEWIRDADRIIRANNALR